MTLRRIIVCERCGHKFVDNTEKHKSRPKYCPNCRYPYKTSSIPLTDIQPFKKLKQTFQRMFNFFPSRGKKKVYYVCPRCSYTAESDSDIHVWRVPDKIKYDETGNEQVLSWREIPVCPVCGKPLIRRRKK